MHSLNWAPAGDVDQESLEKFTAYINDDLNIPRAIALSWDILRSDMPPAIKKGTILEFDRVFGLGLAEWKPREEESSAELDALLFARQQARTEKRWKDADAIRDQIAAAGYEILDTPQGAKLRKKK